MTPITNFTIALDKLELMTEHSVLLSDVIDLTSINRTNAKSYYNYGATSIIKLADVDRDNNSNYHLAYSIKSDGKNVGVLYTAKTKFYLSDKSLIKIRLDNEILYTKDWAIHLQSVLNDLKLRVHNITYLEVALDTNSEARSLFYHYFDNDTDYHFVGGKRLLDNVDSWSKEYRNGDVNKTVYLGKTNKKMSLYNKTLEIQKSHKHYITDFHQLNGLDITQDIERLEVKLKNNALKRYETKFESKFNANETISSYAFSKLSDTEKRNYNKITTKTELEIYQTIDDNDFLSVKKEKLVILDNLSDSNYLLSLFKENCLIDFREKTDNNINRCQSVPFIVFPPTINIIKQTEMKMLPTKNNIQLKRMIKDNLRQFILTDMQALKESALIIANKYQLTEHYEKTLAELTPKLPTSNSADVFPFS